MKGIQQNPLFEKTAKQQNSKTLLQQHGKSVKSIEKVTHYLAPESVNKLEKIWYESRTKFGTRLTRSVILEKAIILLEREFTEKKENSFLFREL